MAPTQPTHAARAAEPPEDSPGHAAEDREPSRRRHLASSILLTLLSAIIPGLGLLGAKRSGLRLLGLVTTLVAVGSVTFLAVWAFTDFTGVAKFIANPRVLTVATPVFAGLGLLWVGLILLTHLATRPAGMRVGRRLIGAVTVTALAFAAAAPSALAARYTRDAFLLLNSILPDDVVASGRPDLAGNNPWANLPRLNILLLGADGDVSRTKEVEQFGIRTDTIMVASIDTATGNTVLIQIPRNLQRTPFPKDSELAKAYPNGFTGTPEGDWYINSIWPKVELERPELLKGNTYRGAEALKLGVQGVTGLKMHYFLMLNIDGLQKLIDAMGGVTVNINERLPIGGNSNNRRASEWLEAGPNQHLDGFHGLWYARSRWSTDDYDRMRRQSCLVNAIVDQADPPTLLTRFEGIAAAGADMIKTDIPSSATDAIVDLAMRVKDGDVKRLVFTPGKNGYSYASPNFKAMHASVEEAINPDAAKKKKKSASPSPSPSPSKKPSPSASSSAAPEGAQNVKDACAYAGS